MKVPFFLHWVKNRTFVRTEWSKRHQATPSHQAGKRGKRSQKVTEPSPGAPLREAQRVGRLVRPGVPPYSHRDQIAFCTNKITQPGGMRPSLKLSSHLLIDLIKNKSKVLTISLSWHTFVFSTTWFSLIKSPKNTPGSGQARYKCAQFFSDLESALSSFSKEKLYNTSLQVNWCLCLRKKTGPPGIKWNGFSFDWNFRFLIIRVTLTEKRNTELKMKALQCDLEAEAAVSSFLRMQSKQVWASLLLEIL